LIWGRIRMACFILFMLVRTTSLEVHRVIQVCSC